MNKEYWKNRAIAENKIKKLSPNIDTKSVIYTWYRVKEYSVYVGQAKNNKERTISHFMAYDHLGKSLRKHGIYDKNNNPTGWRYTYYYCDTDKLDEKEREEIAKYLNREEIDLFNITCGGQNAGKVDINQRQAPKGYKEGVEQGKKVILRQIKELFDKYLVAEIKDKPNKVKERKLQEFYELLK